MTVVDTPRLGIDRYLRSAWARRLTLLVFVVSAAIAIFVLPNNPPTPYRIDFDVYRMGGRVFLDNGDLYGTLPTLGGGSYLPFTYPPLAAALFSVFTVVPLGLGQGLFTAVTIACLLLVCRIVVAHLTDRPSTDLWWLATAATTVGLWLEPVRDTLNFGQINIVLMTLVIVDALLGRGRWWRGLLVGLAISIKLTPAVFLLLFFLRRDWRALAVSAGSAAAYAGIGYLLAADESVTYWTSTLFDTERIGSPQFANNQSAKGELARLGIESEIVWLGVALVVGLLIAWSAWRLLSASASRNGRDETLEVAAVLTVAFAWLFCSPVAWDHSWVWIVPLLMVLIALAARPGASRIWWWLVGTGLVVFAYAPHQHVRQRYDAELSWAWWQHVVGSSYLIWGLAVIVSFGMLAPRLTSASAVGTPSNPAG
ncbi:glycosyltransferase 87 family protein [Gordonia westfalica]|uniref:Glycosyltransferase 87 family protein n=1 Tax=Gordonia westfalica TaxID=158898 RepID=A0ABU2GQQ4_9ACTN|nr:glycosyltransferase 87 family protein [Gordonia westfalica]MDS1113801.1 glycosyltransferase 87 family protein [Gordonia westfalica]